MMMAGMTAGAAAPAPPVVLLLDLEVDPSMETELASRFRGVFRPAIRKQPGFADVRLLKLRKELAGKAPARCSYRLLISFDTEEQRLAWVATADHQRAWPAIEQCLTGQKYIALLYDPVV
jgi:heme-degrading monooxygenase HmoA